MLTAVDRFFANYQREISKSFNAYNDNLNDLYSVQTTEITAFVNEIEGRIKSLHTDKILRTIMTHYTTKQV